MIQRIHDPDRDLPRYGWLDGGLFDLGGVYGPQGLGRVVDGRGHLIITSVVIGGCNTATFGEEQSFRKEKKVDDKGYVFLYLITLHLDKWYMYVHAY